MKKLLSLLLAILAIAQPCFAQATTKPVPGSAFDGKLAASAGTPNAGFGRLWIHSDGTVRRTMPDGSSTTLAVAGSGVTSFNARTGVVVPATNDYTWAQINKTTSSIADITTRSHTLLSDIGTRTHAQIDTALDGLVIGTNVQAYSARLTEYATIGPGLQIPRVNAGATAIEYFTINFTDLAGSATDAQIPNTITIDNLTQITTRSHTSLTDIGTNTHAQIDTHIAASIAHGVSGNIVGTSDSQTLTNKVIAGGSNTISGITETMITLADNTTNNASTSNHGFLKKLSNVSTEYLNGQGNWVTISAGVGGSGTTNTIPLFSASTTLADSAIKQSSGSISINSSTFPSKLKVHHSTATAIAALFSTGNEAFDSGLPGDLSTTMVHIGGKSYAANKYWGLSFGYVDGGIPAAGIYYRMDSDAGQTNGSIHIATRPSTSNVAPTIRLSVGADGTTTLTGGLVLPSAGTINAATTVAIQTAGTTRLSVAANSAVFQNACKVVTIASSTSVAAMQIQSGAAPTSPSAGDVWNDSTQKTLAAFPNGITQTLNGTLWTQTNDRTITNTTSETSLFGSTGTGSLTLPANFFVIGKTVEIDISGRLSTDAADAPNSTFKIKLGATVVATVATSPILLPNLTNAGWNFRGKITCRTVGGTGTVIAQGHFYLFDPAGGQSYAVPLVSTSTTTVDTTGALALDATYQADAADSDNSIVSTNSDATVKN